MSNIINWGKIYEKTAWGIGVITNTISWGKIYANLVGLLPSFSLNFATISDDFTFTRSSFATRVNEFGLIETVTDLGSDLVQNGDFEELGSELVTVENSTQELVSLSASTNISVEVGVAVVSKTYKFTFEVYDYVEGGIYILRPFDATSSNLVSANGTYTFYGEAVSTAIIFRTFGTSTTLKIRNISVKQVDPNDDWSFNNVSGLNGWRIADGRAICDTVNPLSGRNLASTTVLTSGKTYKLTLDILQSVDGMTILVGGTSLPVKLPIGTNLGYEYIIDSSLHTGGLFSLFASTSDLQEVDNISVKEVLEDDVPRIDYSTGEAAFLLEPQSTNLYLNSETLSTQDITTLASTYTVSFRGTGTITFSGSHVGSLVGTGSMDLVSVTFTATAGTLTSTVSGDVKYAQIEELGYSTSWIPTEGAIATRSAETCVKNNLSTDGILGGKEGTFFLHTTDMAVVGTSLNGLGLDFRLYRQSGDAYRFFYFPDLSWVGSNIDLSNNGGELKMAFSITETKVDIYVNGSLHVSYTYTNPVTGNLETWLWSTETKYKERVKDFKIYDKALTDEELTLLTS